MKADITQTTLVRNSPLPNVSVIIPCFNYAQYLTEAVTSVHNQTYQNFEIIIVNDGSTDNFHEVADFILSEYDRNKIKILNQKNSGQPAIARNNGIKKAKGKYILCLDADDKLSNNYLKEANDIFLENKDVSIVFPNLQHFGDDETYVEFSNRDPQLVFSQNCFLVSSIFEKEVWCDCGGYSTNVAGYEDWDFWVNAVSRGYRTKHSKNSILYYRKHGAGMYTVGQDRDLKNKANIVLNNYKVYSNLQIKWAKHIILGEENIDFNNQEGAIPIFDDFRWKYNKNLSKMKKGFNKSQIKLNKSKISAPSYEKFRIQNELPTVSIILTTYNREALLKRSIISVLNQNYPNIELLVINDGGNCVKNSINELGLGYRYNYLSLGSNHGLAGARNYGLRLCQGDYICFLDDDDYLEEDHVISLLNEIKKLNVDVVYSNSKRIYEEYDGNKFISKKIIDPDPGCMIFHTDRILIHNAMPVNTVMFSRKSFEDTGYFDETLTVHEDWEYWIRLSRKYYFHHLNKTTCAVTERSDNMSLNQGRDFCYTMKRIHNKYPSSLEEIKTAQNIMLEALYDKYDPITNAPLISIILYSTNNKELEYLEECIHSIVNNTRSVSFEIVLVINQEINIIHKHILDYSNAKLITIQKNIIPSVAINKGAQIATGKYIVIMQPFARAKMGWVRAMLNHFELNGNINLLLGKTQNLNCNYPTGLKYNNKDIEIIYKLNTLSGYTQYIDDNYLILSDLIFLELRDFKESGGFPKGRNFNLNIFKLCDNLRFRAMNVALTEDYTCLSNNDVDEKELIYIKNEYLKIMQQNDFLMKVKMRSTLELIQQG